MKPLPTLERVREVLAYDPQTGIFTWLSRRSSRSPAGGVAGTKKVTRRSVRWVVMIDERQIHAGPLAWLLMTGGWPCAEVDHRDGDALNNKWSNLRDVTRSVNMENRRAASANNSSGFLGVSPENHKFKSEITVRGTPRRIGVFDTPEEAHAAYVNAKRVLHEGCTI